VEREGKNSATYRRQWQAFQYFKTTLDTVQIGP